MICNQCGNKYQSYFKKSRFCSKFCMGKFFQKRSQEERQKRIELYNLNPKKCLKCGNLIEYIHSENKFCSHQCSGSFNTKGRKHSEETKDKIRQWTKDHSNEIKESSKKARIKRYGSESLKIKKVCPICKNPFMVYKSAIFCSRKCFIQDSKNGYIFSKKPISGGVRKGAGRSKSGYYKNIFCNSTYELAYVIYNLDHGVEFVRNNEGFEYEYLGRKLKYYPDFIEGNLYIEIKGYLRPEDELYGKKSSHVANYPWYIINYDILAEEIKPYMDYVKQTYQCYNLEKLYEIRLKENKKLVLPAGHDPACLATPD